MKKIEFTLATPVRRLLDRYEHLNWALLDQAMVSGINFLVGILLVRYLGIEEYGQYVLAYMIVQFFMSVQNSLIIAPLFSIAPKLEKPELPTYYSATFVMQVALAIIIGCVFAIGASVLPGTITPSWLTLNLVVPIIACIVVIQLQDYVRRSLFSQGSFKRAFFLDLIAYGGQVLLILIVVRVHPSFEAALFSISATMLLSFVLGLRYLNLAMPSRQEVHAVTKRHWLSAKWLLGSAILQWLSGNYFLIVVGAVFGPAIVGGIRAAQNLLGLSHILFQGLENVVPGAASRRFQTQGVSGLTSYLKKVALMMLLGTGLIAASAAIFSEPLLRLVYGAPNPSSVAAMIWFVPLYVLGATALPIRAGLRTLECTYPIFVAYALGAVLSVSVAHYLVSRYEINGAMGGMLFVDTMMTLVLLYSLSREVRKHANSLSS